jgi:hypothetical protein
MTAKIAGLIAALMVASPAFAMSAGSSVGAPAAITSGGGGDHGGGGRGGSGYAGAGHGGGTLGGRGASHAAASRAADARIDHTRGATSSANPANNKNMPLHRRPPRIEPNRLVPMEPGGCVPRLIVELWSDCFHSTKSPAAGASSR